MLTEAEMQEYIELAERDEWDPARWRLEPNPRKDAALFVVGVSDEQRAALESRARERGMDSADYLENLIGAVLSAV